MTDLSTERLSLHLLTVDEGRRIVDAAPGEQDVWAEDFPMQDDRDGAKGFLGAAEAGHDAGPFGCYRIDRDGAAIGNDRLLRSARRRRPGHVRLRTRARSARSRLRDRGPRRALVAFCRSHDEVLAMVADTETSNTASQRVLDKTGFAMVKEEEGLYFYRQDVATA